MRRRVYIAGPISKGDICQNVQQATDAFYALLKAGYAPFCPHWSCYAGGPVGAAVPAAVHPGTTHDDWLGVDLPWVAVAGAVLRLPGESVGADLEVKTAREFGIPVFHRISDLLDEFPASERFGGKLDTTVAV